MSTWNPDDYVSSQEVPPKRSRAGYALFVLGAIALLLHHGWAAGLGRGPSLELVLIGCFLVAFNLAGWAAPKVSAAVEGRAAAAGWTKVLWFAFVVSAGAAMTWSVGRFAYGVNWPW
jgi:hypothetical protein